jgi:uncharacterized protein
MSYLPGKFVWFEHLSADSTRAREFYEALFGWRTEVMPIGEQRYPMIMNGGDGIGGYGNSAPNVASRWMAYLSVADVDASFEAALAAGARSIVAPMDFGPVGRGATIADPNGAVLSLWKSADGDRPDPTRTPPGNFVWNELWASDQAKALTFYTTVFGFSHDGMDMGPQGVYHLLKKDGVNRGGIARSVNPKAMSMWLPYVEVSDCDAAAAKVATLGGRVLLAPADIPGVGRYAIAHDPLGAPIALLRSNDDAT